MDHMNVQHPAIDQMVAHHPRDPLVIQGRLEACTASLKVVENHVYGRKKKMRKLNQSLKILMSDCLLMFTTLATDYGVEVAAATEALDLIELLALPMLSTGRREHRPERLCDSLSGITAAYLTQLQALYATVEEEARAAASAQLVVDRRSNSVVVKEWSRDNSQISRYKYNPKKTKGDEESLFLVS